MNAWRVCRLDYVEQAMEAERRLRKGERQRWCPGCGKWRWDDEPCCPDVRRLTQKQLDRKAKEGE